jgi:TonB family protein
MLKTSADRMLVATIAGSLVWHVMAVLLFSSVFEVALNPGEKYEPLPPVLVRHLGAGSGLGFSTDVEDTLAALEIHLPAKDTSERIEPIGRQEEEVVIPDELEAPVLVDRINPVADGTRGVGGSGTGVGPGPDSEKRTGLPVGELTLKGKGSERKIVNLPPSPTYPRECELSGTEGDVVLSFVVSEEGSVTSVLITRLSGSSLLDQAAKEYLLKFVFEKASYKTTGTVTIRFRLRKGR